MKKIYLIILSLVGVLLVQLSMYVVPSIDSYKELEWLIFFIGVIVILVALVWDKKTR